MLSYYVNVKLLRCKQ